jgi:outer membrane protein
MRAKYNQTNQLSTLKQTMINKRIGLISLFLLWQFCSVNVPSGFTQSSDPSTSKGPSKTIAVFVDGDFAHAKKLFQSIRKEVSLLEGDYYQAKFLPEQTAAWDPGRVDSLLKQALADPTIDVILVSGPLFTLAAKSNFPLPKPVVVASLLDPDVLGMPQTPEGATGVPNFYYASKTGAMGEDLRLFRRVLKFDTVHILVVDGLKAYAQKVVDKLGEKDFKVELISGTGTITEILARIDKAKVQALYLTPLNLSHEDQQILLDEINKRKIPTFSYKGYEEVEAGALAGRVPKVMTQFSRRVAITIDRILKGEDAGTIPTRLDLENALVVNQRTANLIEMSLPFDILMNAEVLFREDLQGENLSMQQAVDNALENNLNFKIIAEQIKAVGKDYWLAWSQYLPLAQFYLDYGRSDFDKSRYSSTVPRENIERGVSLNQLIFSHPVLRQISNAKMQISIEELNRDTAILDITDQTVRAYLNYLRAKALMKVEQERLKAVTENLAVAQRRLDTGLAGKEEVLRWEAELANEKSLVLLRDSAIFQTRVILNQLMNKQQEEIFSEQDVGLETLQYYIGGKSLNPYINNLETLKVFLDFSVQQAMNNSPEIQALGVGIKQQRNNVKSADGRFVLPEVSVDGEIRDTIDQDYYGDDRVGDENGWDVGLRVSYPLFDRGRRPIESMKERDLLRQLEYSQFLKEQEIERDLRLAAYEIYNSLPSIELKRMAMESTAQEYEIMQLKYKEGLVSYVDLVNIQTDKFQREADAVIAIYNFFDNLSKFDRQEARFYMLDSEQNREKWLKDARDYFESRGVTMSD